MRMRMERHVTLIFHLVLKVAFLALARRIVISMSTFKRTLRQLKLQRIKDHSDLLDVAMFKIIEHETSDKLYGYRWKHSKCSQINLQE